jgi:hypothetical protein
MQLSEQQKRHLADVHAVFRELLQAVEAQETSLMQPQSGNGSNGGSSGRGRGSSSSSGSVHLSSSSNIAAVQSKSRLQQNIRLLTGVQQAQRKVCAAVVRLGLLTTLLVLRSSIVRQVRSTKPTPAVQPGNSLWSQAGTSP